MTAKTTKTTKKTAKKTEKTETQAPETTLSADAPAAEASESRAAAPVPGPGEMLVRDVRIRLLDCNLECAHPGVFADDSDVFYMKGNKSQWKKRLAKVDKNRLMKASYEPEGRVLRIG